MSEIFKEVIDAEAKSKEIIDKAKAEAEKIKADTNSRLNAVYQQSYDKTMKELPDETAKINREAKERAEKEAESASKGAQAESADLKSAAAKKIDKVADEIFKELTKI